MGMEIWLLDNPTGLLHSFSREMSYCISFYISCASGTAWYWNWDWMAVAQFLEKPMSRVIEIWELSFVQRVRQLRRHYHPKRPRVCFIVSWLAVNVGRKWTQVVFQYHACWCDDIWLKWLMALRGSQGRILKQPVTLAMKSRDQWKPAWAPLNCLSLFIYSPGSKTRGWRCPRSDWGSWQHLTIRTTPYWSASWSTWSRQSATESLF